MKPLEVETLPRDELIELQNKKLQYTLKKHTHTPCFGVKNLMI